MCDATVHWKSGAVQIDRWIEHARDSPTFLNTESKKPLNAGVTGKRPLQRMSMSTQEAGSQIFKLHQEVNVTVDSAPEPDPEVVGEVYVLGP
jgi:hypothetical protein